MKVGFPVIQNEGMESTIYGHFGSAPLFLVVDTDKDEITAIENKDELAPEAGCNPFKALVNKQVNAFVVGGVGDGLMKMLNMLGIVVYEAKSASLKENVELFKQNGLVELEMMNSVEEGRCNDDEGEHTCSHHAH